MILIIAFFGYLIFNGILLFHHEAWRDEANAWLVARELSFTQLFAEIKYQGHPCLWYLLLMPAAKLGLPFYTINWISYFIMAIATGIFLFKAPLMNWVKIIVIFSPVFTYSYSVVARNYCLSALIVILLALFYSKRNEKVVLYGLLLGLLVQSDIIALMPAGMISVMWLCESLVKSRKEKNWKPFLDILKGIWIPLVSLFILIAQFYNISDSPVYKVNEYDMWGFIDALRKCSQGIFWGLAELGEKFAVVWLLLLLTLAFLTSVQLKNFWAAVVMISSYVFQIMFSALVYSLHRLHSLFLCFVLVWTIWTWHSQKKERGLEGKKNLSLIMKGGEIVFLILIVCMLMFWCSNEQRDSLQNIFSKTYSDGINVAHYIEENLSSDEVFVSDYVPRASTVIAFLDEEYDFYYAGSGKKTTYADWSEEQGKEIMLEDLIDWVKSNFPEKEAFYLMITRNSCVKQAEKLSECEIVYQTAEETVKDEEYTLYRVLIR